MSRRGLLLLFLLAFAVFAAARLPLAAALRLTDAVAARRVEGTVWNGRLDGAMLSGREVGDLHLALAPWPLLLGRLRIHWTIEGGPLAGAGTLTLRPGGAVRIADSRLSGPLAALSPPLPVAGDFRAEVSDIRFGPEGCRHAAGRLWSDAAARSAALLDWRGPALEGEIACAQDALLLPLAGRDGGTGIELRLLLRPDRRHTATLDIATDDARLRQGLPALGFACDATVCTLAMP